jgi:tRNA-(ms[2]io[6]A)-hydroxylase
MSLEHILQDHAFCEQKAATQSISIIQQYGHMPGLVETLSPIVTEEWGHFRMVFAALKERGFELGPQRKDEYVNLLMAYVPKGGNSDHKLLHKLLLCALIEARSCERFRLLSEQLPEESLRRFYHKFMVSEDGHYRVFIDLAAEYYPRPEVDAQWAYWLNCESKVLAQLELRGDRMH